MITIDVITLFPGMFENIFDDSIIGRAQEKGLAKIAVHQLREWATDKHHTVDDRPYGGGVGMVLKVDVLVAAIEALKTPESHVVLMTPQGEPFKQSLAKTLSTKNHIILVCGRYEGFDERVRAFVDQEISIGDYVLTGGEIPAMAVIDAVVRLVPGVLEKEDATTFESFSENTLEYPQYTRPDDFRGMGVPEVLKKGNHKEIEAWRSEQSLKKTEEKRPDLV